MNYLVVIAGVFCFAAVVCSAEESASFAESSQLSVGKIGDGNPLAELSDPAIFAQPALDSASDEPKVRQKRQFFGGYGGYGGYGFRRRGFGFGGYGGGFRRFGGYGGYGGYGYGR